MVQTWKPREKSIFIANPAKQIQVKEYEKQIDQIVHELNSLTDEEMKIVEWKTL